MVPIIHLTSNLTFPVCPNLLPVAMQKVVEPINLHDEEPVTSAHDYTSFFPDKDAYNLRGSLSIAEGFYKCRWRSTAKLL
ncbi:hypothetical protein [Parachlamydia acanthamoebae]|uniref:hypothetical protein n=1 Tax=Parachlamydia acanthamoebae TaxID=83552 RepID=UPI0024E22B8B|nr:hypothetical protein [Parachlamydia acanthamoebae]